SKVIDKIIDDKIKTNYSDLQVDDQEIDDLDISDDIYNDIISDKESIEKIADAFEEEVIGKSNMNKKKNTKLVTDQNKAIEKVSDKFKMSLEKSNDKKIDKSSNIKLNTLFDDSNVSLSI